MLDEIPSFHCFHPSILRQSDIRGIVGETLFTMDAVALGRAFAALLGTARPHRVVVGCDGRLTSGELEAALVAGLTAGGADVVRIGRGPTPMLYFAAATLRVDGGIMVTGSHNPPEHNGFKLLHGGKPVYGSDIQRLATMTALGARHVTPGRVDFGDVFDNYVKRLVRDYDGAGPLRVAWDPGNGAAGEVVSRLIQSLPGRHFVINATIDGHFPAHHPDPAVAANLVQLQELVRAEQCDIGIAFDGDGDRIGVVDAQGCIVWADQLMAVLARDVLRRHPGAPIIADVKSSQMLFDEIVRCGGRPVMLPTGHALLKVKVAELGSPLAGEMSGHIFVNDGYYGFDDAVYVAVRLIGLLGRSAESLADMIDALPAVFNTPELRLPCPEHRKFAIVNEIRERVRRRDVQVIDIDGVRVKTNDGWWLLRASTTQAMVVARAEATTRTGFERVKRELAAELAASGLTLPKG